MNYLFNTNIIMAYLRNHRISSQIEATYQPLSVQNIPIVSVVTIGELRSFALQRNWGSNRINALENFLKQFVTADINAEDVIEKYGEIDAFSQGKLKSFPLNDSARNMGKNDLWIAATASVAKAKLFTTDADFDHLNKHFLEVIKFDPTSK